MDQSTHFHRIAGIAAGDALSCLSVTKTGKVGTFGAADFEPVLDFLETGEVDLAAFHELDSLISSKVKVELEQIKKNIIAGKIKTKP